MTYLIIEQAQRLGISVECATLPHPERARYIPPTTTGRGRIIIHDGLDYFDARRAGLIALGHALNGSTDASAQSMEAATLRGLEVALENVARGAIRSDTTTRTGVLSIVHEARTAAQSAATAPGVALVAPVGKRALGAIGGACVAAAVIGVTAALQSFGTVADLAGVFAGTAAA